MTDGARGGENDRPGREGVAVLAGVVGGGALPEEVAFVQKEAGSEPCR